MTEGVVRGGASILEPLWRAKAFEALERMGEMLGVCYVPYRAGWAEWHLLHTRDELEELLSFAKARSILDFYLSPQLPLRGVADEALEQEAVKCLRSSGEVLLASKTGRVAGTLPTFLDHSGADDESDLHEWFRDHSGLLVFVGSHPALLPEGHPDVLNGRVPDLDGKVRAADF